MTISTLKCNHITNPLGFTMGIPVFSWKTESETASFQAAARVEISLEEAFGTLVHDSGLRAEVDSLAYSPVPAVVLAPRTRYFWRVTVQADNGAVAVSDAAWFETGKMDEPFVADFVTAPDKDVPPLLRKRFSLKTTGNIVSARLYASAAGLYEAEINGKKVGEVFLAPFCNKYSAWMQVQTYDVTALLRAGDNCLGVMLGDGWYKGRFGFDGGASQLFGDRLGFLGELHVRYADGSTEVVSTDTTWQSAPSHIVFSSIYDGEHQDMRKALPGWSTPEMAVGGEWQGVEILDVDKSLLMDRLSLPVVVKETRKPVAVITTPAGETVLDMGQNMVGWVTCEVTLPEGAELELLHGEILQNGNFYQDNLRDAKQAFRFISDGKPHTLRPHFTYYGFRYVRVEGWPGTPTVADFTGCVVYSDMDRTGWLETSDKKVNQLIANALWGQKGNFLDVPTDCPQRDERMGWTGDAQVFCATATFNMDTHAFYRKYLYDMQKEQELSGGVVPVVVPNMIRNTGYVMTSSAWADATTIIPWTSYLFSGDKSVLEAHYPSMKAYIETLRAQDDGSRLWKRISASVTGWRRMGRVRMPPSAVRTSTSSPRHTTTIPPR
jgi:alpha-L-rhamnosidase